jgi:drug/metabolite transporter (DMT)-like permease
MTSGWMVVAGFLFGLMGVFVKLGSAKLSAAELVFYRSAVGLMVIYASVLVRSRGGHQGFSTPHGLAHLSRSLSGFFALMLFFYSIGRLPLATAVTLNYTSPLFLALFTVLVLRERPRLMLLGALLLGFLGIALLLKPSLHRDELPAAALGLASGFLAGVAYLNVRQLGRLGEPEWRTVFYFTLVSTLGAGLWMLVHEFHSLSWEIAAIIAGLGTTATLAQLALTRAYRLGKTLVVGALAYSTVIFASLFGIVFWQDYLSVDEWLAIGLVVASGVLAVRATPASTDTRQQAPGAES